MTSGPVGQYLRELERTLRERGCHDARIVDEAREHLADAVEDGLRRGLAREDAEHEALERFGPPDLIAAQALPPRGRTMARLTSALDTVLHHWRWVTAATAVAWLVTSVASSYWLPTTYRSEAVIAVLPQRVPPEYIQPASDASIERVWAMSQTILSRPRLEGLARDFGLETRRDNDADGVQEVRRSIRLAVSPAAGPDSFTVGFQSQDPTLALRVTERLAGMFIQENLIDAQAVGHAIGDQFKIVSAARLPDRPLGPSRTSVNATGAFAGLTLAIAALVWRKPRAALP